MSYAYAILNISKRGIIKYPYTENDLRAENASTIYTGQIDLKEIYPNTEIAIKEGNVIVEVEDATQPEYDKTNSRIEEVMPTLQNGKWARTWNIIDHTDDERAAKINDCRYQQLRYLNEMADKDIAAIKSGYPEQVTNLWFVMLTEALVIKKNNGDLSTALLSDALKPGETPLELADKIIAKNAEFRKRVSPIIGKLRRLTEVVEKSTDVQEILNTVW